MAPKIGGKTRTSFKAGDPPTATSFGPGNTGNPNPPNQFGEGNAGRPKGTRNKKDIGADVVEKLDLKPDERPLSFFVKMMMGKPFEVRKMDAAGHEAIEKFYPTIADMKWGAAMAAPYMHPKLANIEHTGNLTLTHEDFVEKLLNEENGGDRATRH